MNQTPNEGLPVVARPDMLRAIFDSQARFQARVEDKANSICQREWNEAFDDRELGLSDEGAQICEYNVQRHALCLMMEAAELMDWTRWKHWSKRLGNKQEFRPGSVEHIHEMRVEVADLLCFLVNVAMALGMDADALYEQYRSKADVNHQRQDRGGY